jgi:fibrillarin-like rRNA methylase
MSTQKPTKPANVLEIVREHAKEGRVVDTRHSISRSKERCITFSEIMQVLKTGWHEKAKDAWKAEYQAWNFAIRGKTLDGVELRVPVFFINEDPKITYLGVATTINLCKKQEA